jgi:CRISPR-associated protein Csb2
VPTLIFRFPGRRYHATPWGHHVNEGLIELPPSPWRLLRGLLATGYATLDWPSDGPPRVARALIEKLAGVLPHYRLPRSVGAHSRHYMPLAVLDKKKGREDTTLVFDTWAQVDEGDLAVTWDVTLAEAETRLLSDLARRMGYLGRSESWVIGRIARPEDALPESSECMPSDGVAAPGPGWEQVPLMAAQCPDRYATWREEAVKSVLAKLPPLEPGKRVPKNVMDARRKAEAPYPLDLIACLQMTTDELRRHGWSQPPGSQRVFYWRRSDVLESGAPALRPRRGVSRPVEAILLSMATATRNDHALPPVIRTLPQAERLHKQLVGYLGGAHHAALTGRDEHRQPLKRPHVHAHILPLDLDRDGHLEHMLIWAPMGLDGPAQSAVRAVRKTFAKGGVGPLRLVLEAAGSLEDLRTLRGVYGAGLRGLLGPSAGSTDWVSVTPFVPPRHLKGRGKNSLEGQVQAELRSRGLPVACEVCPADPGAYEAERAESLAAGHNGPQGTPAAGDQGWLRLRHFVRARRFGPPPPVDVGFALRLRFERPLCGPICLGYGSHFGLGRFEALDR